jgi:hypothetical protein
LDHEAEISAYRRRQKRARIRHARPRPWRLVRRLNAMVMTVYLWHFVPVIVIAVAFYPTGVMPQPAIGSAQWWELRPAWSAVTRRGFRVPGGGAPVLAPPW